MPLEPWPGQVPVPCRKGREREMVTTVGILAAIGVIALLPACELVRRALIGRRFEASLVGQRPGEPVSFLPRDELAAPIGAQVEPRPREVGLAPIESQEELDLTHDRASA